MHVNKKWAALAAAVILLASLTACAPASPQDIVAEGLGIDISGGSAVSHSDTHGGLHGDGTTCIVLAFDDDALLEQIRESWNAFPLDETVTALAYGTGSAGPYLADGEGRALLPEIQNGYCLLIDRQADRGGDILDRAAFNFTLGLYDADTQTLYYFELDT